MDKTLVLDMDGTLCDLYNTPKWLDCILSEDATPYLKAYPIGNAKINNHLFEILRALGWDTEVVTWLPKGTPSGVYCRAVRRAKRLWLRRYYPTLAKHVHITKYGTNKWYTSNHKGGILLDDEPHNVDTWNTNTNGGAAVHITPQQDVTAILLQLINHELNK